MPFQFGTVFSDAMQRALAAENQKKKDVFDYNMNVDKLNLDKWNAYNSLNLNAYNANEANRRWGEEMRLKVDDTNWQRQFDVKKFNTDLDITKARDFFTATPEMQQGYQGTYGMAFPISEAPGTGGLHSWNYMDKFARPLGESKLQKAMADEQNATTRWVAELQTSTNTKIAEMNIAADKEMFNLRTNEERANFKRDLDIKAQNTIMVRIGPKGDILETGYPQTWSDLTTLKNQGYVLLSDYNNMSYNSLNNVPTPQKKTTYTGVGNSIKNAVKGAPDR